MIRQKQVVKSRRAQLIFLPLLVAVIVIAGTLWLFGSAAGAIPQADSVLVGLVTDAGGLDDNGLNWASYQGLRRAESELGVLGTVYTSVVPADYEINIQQCVDDGNDLCISVGFFSADALRNAALTNSGIDFAVVDSEYESYPANLRGITFAAEEAGYLAGTLAGLMTQSDIVGDIGGMEIPSVTSFTLSYRNGARCANPQATILLTYTNDFGNPALGAQVAQDMIDQGADVIFAAAGGTGNGSVYTATQNSVWAIGVDIDAYLSLFGGGAVPGAEYVLSSAIKRYDTAVYATIGDVVSGTFTSGTKVYTLAEDGVGLAPFHEAEQMVPQNVRDELEAVRWQIVEGQIDVTSEVCSEILFLPALRAK